MAKTTVYVLFYGKMKLGVALNSLQPPSPTKEQQNYYFLGTIEQKRHRKTRADPICTGRERRGSAGPRPPRPGGPPARVGCLRLGFLTRLSDQNGQSARCERGWAWSRGHRECLGKDVFASDGSNMQVSGF